MIQLIDRREIPRLLSFCKGSPYGVRISAFLQAYGTSYPFALFWMQTDASGRITAALSRVDGHVTLCASEQADWEEVWAFFIRRRGMRAFCARSGRRKRPACSPRAGWKAAVPCG